MDENIQKLLATTGLSCDDLLEKLQHYKKNAVGSQSSLINQHNNTQEKTNESNNSVQKQESDLGESNDGFDDNVLEKHVVVTENKKNTTNGTGKQEEFKVEELANVPSDVVATHCNSKDLNETELVEKTESIFLDSEVSNSKTEVSESESSTDKIAEHRHCNILRQKEESVHIAVAENENQKTFPEDQVDLHESERSTSTSVTHNNTITKETQNNLIPIKATTEIDNEIGNVQKLESSLVEKKIEQIVSCHELKNSEEEKCFSSNKTNEVSPIVANVSTDFPRRDTSDAFCRTRNEKDWTESTSYVSQDAVKSTCSQEEETHAVIEKESGLPVSANKLKNCDEAEYHYQKSENEPVVLAQQEVDITGVLKSTVDITAATEISNRTQKLDDSDKDTDNESNNTNRISDTLHDDSFAASTTGNATDKQIKQNGTENFSITAVNTHETNASPKLVKPVPSCRIRILSNVSLSQNGFLRKQNKKKKETNLKNTKEYNLKKELQNNDHSKLPSIECNSNSDKVTTDAADEEAEKIVSDNNKKTNGDSLSFADGLQREEIECNKPLLDDKRCESLTTENIEENQPNNFKDAKDNDDVFVVPKELPWKRQMQDVEEVRNKIRTQLELLRTRKKTEAISPTVDKDLINRTRPTPKKRKRAEIADASVVSDEKKEETSNSADVLTNDTGCNFTIVSVIGGYKSPTPPGSPEPTPNDSEIQNSSESESRVITLSKTADITKIKGWRNKKFVIPPELQPKPTFTTIIEPEPSTSSSSPITISASVPLVQAENGEALNNVENSNSNSAFISIALDEFLSEHSQLKISFEVPKLEAEQSITQNFTDTSLPQVADIKTAEPKGEVESLLLPKREEVYKPKTLAEKRKMLEKKERKERKKKEEVVKPSFSPSGLKYAYVYYHGKRLRVPTKSDQHIIGYLGKDYVRHLSKAYTYVPLKRDLRNAERKPSLLTSLKEAAVARVSYRPGPLSRKQGLQNSKTLRDWKTIVKNLPKVILEVTPEFKKPLHPKIAEYVQYDDAVLTPERLDFALSAVKNGNAKSKTFKFDIPYAHGQKYMLMRERVLKPTPDVEVSPKKKEENTESEITKVLNEIITSIEISQESEGFIQNDEDCLQTEETPLLKPLSPISKNVGAIIKTTKRRSKTCLELRRLNVKIIDVDVAEPENRETCTKPFCTLGCICKSLECNKSLTLHCRRVECMLKCTCSFGKQKAKEESLVTLPAGTDILSADTVNRLQQQAKRDLAKVEKEFTQTVIQAKDQTIILGAGSRDRQKRVTKAPKKFVDYVDEPLLEHILPKSKEELSMLDVVKRDIAMRVCIVKMLRLDLSEVVPFCWVHNLHDCHCNYLARFSLDVDKSEPAAKRHKPLVNLSREKEVVSESPKLRVEPVKIRIRDINKNAVEPTKRDHAIIKRKKYSKKLKFTRHKQHKINLDQRRVVNEDVCSRTMEVHTKVYVQRNKSKGYLEKVKRRLLRKERKLREQQELTDKSEVVLFPTAQNDEVQIIEDDEDCIKEVEDPLRLPDKDVVQKKAIQRRKRKSTPHIVKSNNSNKDSDTISIMNEADPIGLQQKEFTPEKALSNHFVRLLGSQYQKNTRFKMIPWNIMVERYESEMLCFWYNTQDTSAKVIAGEKTHPPGKNYINIRKFETALDKEAIEIDIIRWLVTKKVPRNEDPKNVCVIMAYHGRNWEVCGICVKGENSMRENPETMTISLVQDNDREMDKLHSDTFRGISYNLFMHKNIDNEPRCIFVVKYDFSEKIYAVIEGMNKHLTLPLPYLYNKSQWYMINLKANFSHVLFNKNGYTIKYFDLLKINRISHKFDKTVILTSVDLGKGYSHPYFGIYSVPTCDDFIYIGPYNHLEEPDIETLGYIRSVLVNTDLYYKMKGQLKKCSCRWVKQLSIGAGENEAEFYLPKDKVANPILPSQTNTSPSTNRGQSILKSSLLKSPSRPTAPPPPVSEVITTIEITESDDEDSDNSSDSDVLVVTDPRAIDESECRKYFVNNVRGLGYIPAYQFRHSKVIDVKWPLSKLIQRFSKVEDAIRSLEKELERVLMPVPPTFKIKVHLVDELDLNQNSPLNPMHLQGHYIVGEFGILDVLMMDTCTLEKYGLTDSQVLEVMTKRSKKIFHDFCCRLGEVFMSKEEVAKITEASEIINRALAEIKTQNEKMKVLGDVKMQLEVKRQVLKQQLVDLIRDLPPEQMEQEKQKFRDITQHKSSNESDTSNADKSFEVSSRFPSATQSAVSLLRSGDPLTITQPEREVPPLSWNANKGASLIPLRNVLTVGKQIALNAQSKTVIPEGMQQSFVPPERLFSGIPGPGQSPQDRAKRKASENLDFVPVKRRVPDSVLNTLLNKNDHMQVDEVITID